MPVDLQTARRRELGALRTRGGNKQLGSGAAGSSVQKAEPAGAAVAQAAGADSHLFLSCRYYGTL